MRLKILAISDTHLGEDTSLLSFPHGRQHLWRTLREQFDCGKDDRIPVEEMILAGDIPDRTLSSTSQIITHTNAFIQMLGSAADIKKGVYVPGNHDHTLWKDYLSLRNGQERNCGITKPRGDRLVEKGERCDEGNSARDLLSVFFGYPAGSSWRKIEKDKEFDFVIANPLYATQINDRTYIFTHGMLFRKDVTAPTWLKKFVDCSQLDKLLAKIDIVPGGDVTRANSLEELERIAAPFVDSLWPSSKNIRASQSDQLWYLLTTLSGKFGLRRPAPEKSTLFSETELRNDPKARIKQLTINNEPNHESLERWQIHFLPHMLTYLKEHDFPREDLTFVYGDTHDGGWGELPLDAGGKVRIYNCGGWVVHHKADHPACHLFAVGEDGREHLLDVSFKNQTVEERSLIELAARDVENRKHFTSIFLQLLLKLLPS